MTVRKLLKVKAAAELLDVSTTTVYRLIERRAIAVFRDPVTGRVRISPDSIDAFIRANTIPARPLVDVTPIPRARKARARTVAGSASAGDEPWRGSVFGPRDEDVATPASDGVDPPWKDFARIPRDGVQRQRPRKREGAGR